MLETLKRIQKGLFKTKNNLVDGIVRIINQAKGIDESLLEDIEEQLLLSDIGVDTVETIISSLRTKSRESGTISADEVIELLKSELIEILDSVKQVEREPPGAMPKPCVISIVGVNGTGKTTTIGKLANRYAQEGKKVLLAAADTFRAAAIEQLNVWKSRAGVDIVHMQTGADPAAVAFDALKAAMSRQVDVLLIDTAGRLHTKGNLMAELTKIHRVLGRQCPGAPHDIFLVMDATTGQNGLSQARKFTETGEVTGIIITKLDGTAKGGIVFAIARELSLPVRYIGLGEKIDDLAPFDSRTFVEALFA
ncbi:signal recognition particle-docking protein FtsY [candidate division KSB1 bacterium]|nr:signal recognition particle-docking protein FtsY [candidate division KSB1 bacterium]